MTGRSLASSAFTAVAVLFVAALVLGQLLGQPVLLGYVTTGSMEPTIDAGDGFVVVPSIVTGEPEVGDVIVFDAREIEGGGLTTHRIVDVTDQGYITRGDANPFTDQDAGEPPVSDGQVLATAVQFQGDVLVIPNLGTAIMGVQSTVESAGERAGSPLAPGSFGPFMVLLGVGLIVLASLTGNREAAHRDVRRSSSRTNVLPVWTAIAIALVIVVGLATAAMVLPGGVHEYGIVSADEPSDQAGVIEAGGSVQDSYQIQNDGLVPVLVVLDPASSGVDVEPRAIPVGSGESAESTVTLHAPEEAGHYLRHVSEHRYLGVLPAPILLALHDVHPLLALLAVDAIIAAVVILLSVAMFGTGHLRLRSVGPRLGPVTRLRRWLD